MLMIRYHSQGDYVGIVESPKRLFLHGTVYIDGGKQPYYVIEEAFDEKNNSGTIVLEKVQYLGYVILTPIE